MISQSLGMDVTALVASHHFSEKIYQTLGRYEVNSTAVLEEKKDINTKGSIRHAPEQCYEKIPSYSFEEKGFFVTLKKRVVAHLEKTHGSCRPRPDRLYGLKVYRQ